MPTDRIARSAGLAFLLAVTAVPNSSAQERTDVIAVSGAWMAGAVRPSLTAKPSVCVVGNLQAGVVFRIDSVTMELRVSDSKWSLPSDVEGKIGIIISENKYSFDVMLNTATTIATILTMNEIISLLDSMDKAPSMTVTIGNAKPFTVSLTGSTVATNAFRTCAGLRGSQAIPPGANPFR